MENLKEVYYYLYCSRCKYKDLPGFDDPCDTCLENPFQVDSHKPREFEEKD